MFRSFVLVLALLVAGPAVAACNASAGGSQGISAINQYRAGQGAGALAYSAKLSSVAEAFACDMIARGYFSHTTPEGQKFNARLRAGGFNGGCGAENIAFTSGSAGVGQAIAQWKGSAPHKRNMLGRRYSVAGLGGASGNGKTIWVLILGNC